MAFKRVLFSKNVFVLLFGIFTRTSADGNIAALKTAEQSSDFLDYKWLAGAAVDGCETTNIQSNCCTHTMTDGSPKTAWWRVDLGQMSSINTIQIIYRNEITKDKERTAGYQLYISNFTDSPTHGVLCYEERSITKDTVQLKITHRCPYVGRYIIVYNYRNNPKRYEWYADDAILSLCEVKASGCPVGFHGDGDCSQACPDRGYGGNCHSNTGFCFQCILGKYGDTCGQDCSVNCKDRLCAKDNGYCTDCINGKYGDTCPEDCSVNCKDRLCAKDTGFCTECVPGKYGNGCEHNCSVNCNDILCEKETAYCIDCVPGRYGSICNQKCSDNCKDRFCDKVTGNCTECTNGKHGGACDIDCPKNCKNNVCIRKTGHCYDCIIGKYDATCALTCPVTCKNFVCDQQTGQCLECYAGKYGVVCGADCLDTCTDSTCNKDDGHCISTADHKLIIIAVQAVIIGLLIAAFITTVICLLRIIQNRKKSSDNDKESSVPDPNYTSLSNEQEGAPHVYEMIVK